MSSEYIKRIRTDTGDKQIDYNALANLPDIYTRQEVDILFEDIDIDITKEKVVSALGFTPININAVNALSDLISNKAVLENGIIKFYKSDEEDTELFSVDISSINDNAGLDLNNLELSVTQVGDVQRLSMSDGEVTKTVDIPMTIPTEEDTIAMLAECGILES